MAEGKIIEQTGNEKTAKTANKSDFTQGSILKKLVLFMMPVLGALILQAAYGAVDLLVVGRFGSTSGLSAVSTGSQVLNLDQSLVGRQLYLQESPLFYLF